MRLPQGWREDTIYVAMDGRIVSRVHSPDGRSFIRKPVPPNSRERWIYDNVSSGIRPLLPLRIASPVDQDASVDEESSNLLWMEDLGPLKHHYDLPLALQLVRAVARWHNSDFAESSRFESLSGLKPSYDGLASQVLADREGYASIASRHGIEPQSLEVLFRLMEQTRLSDDLVFSHGDLHVGNYTFARGNLYVMDWEHAHIGSRYEDLFHVIDLTHPLYPRPESLDWRCSLLQAYLEESGRLGAKLEPQRFHAEYRLFAAVFSLWMLGLIERDLNQPECVWTSMQLRRQAEETAVVLHQLFQRQRAYDEPAFCR